MIVLSCVSRGFVMVLSAVQRDLPHSELILYRMKVPNIVKVEEEEA